MRQLLLIRSLLPERADRVAAFVAVQTETAVAELGEILPVDPLAGEDARQDQIEDGRAVIHAAGGNAEYRHEFGVYFVLNLEF